MKEYGRIVNFFQKGSSEVCEKTLKDWRRFAVPLLTAGSIDPINQ
jgi:hypothetical protein